MKQLLLVLVLCGCGKEPDPTAPRFEIVTGTAAQREWDSAKPMGIVPEDLTAAWPTGSTALYIGDAVRFDTVHVDANPKKRYTIAWNGDDLDEIGTLRVPLSSDDFPNRFPPAVYFEDAAGDVWDAKWIKR